MSEGSFDEGTQEWVPDDSFWDITCSCFSDVDLDVFAEMLIETEREEFNVTTFEEFWCIPYEGGPVDLTIAQLARFCHGEPFDSCGPTTTPTDLHRPYPLMPHHLNHRSYPLMPHRQ